MHSPSIHYSEWCPVNNIELMLNLKSLVMNIRPHASAQTTTGWTLHFLPLLVPFCLFCFFCIRTANNSQYFIVAASVRKTQTHSKMTKSTAVPFNRICCIWQEWYQNQHTLNSGKQLSSNMAKESYITTVKLSREQEVLKCSKYAVYTHVCVVSSSTKSFASSLVTHSTWLTCKKKKKENILFKVTCLQRVNKAEFIMVTGVILLVDSSLVIMQSSFSQIQIIQCFKVSEKEWKKKKKCEKERTNFISELDTIEFICMFQ